MSERGKFSDAGLRRLTAAVVETLFEDPVEEEQHLGADELLAILSGMSATVANWNQKRRGAKVADSKLTLSAEDISCVIEKPNSETTTYVSWTVLLPASARCWVGVRLLEGGEAVELRHVRLRYDTEDRCFRASLEVPRKVRFELTPPVLDPEPQSSSTDSGAVGDEQ